jgi:hypothetical protein
MGGLMTRPPWTLARARPNNIFIFWKIKISGKKKAKAKTRSLSGKASTSDHHHSASSPPAATFLSLLDRTTFLSLSARPSFRSSFTGKASRRHWPPHPQKLSLSPSPFCLSLYLLYATDRYIFSISIIFL